MAISETRNDYKSWKVMTVGAPAYRMLVLHPYRWNQLKVIRLAVQESLSWTLAALPSSAADVMSQSDSHGGASNLTLTLHYC